MRVWVVVASKYGSAREVAEAIAEEIRHAAEVEVPIGDPPKPEDAGPEGISDVLEATRASAHEVFAGRLDYGSLRRVERLMVKALRAPEGDFRDWKAIRSWASQIAEQLR